VKDFTPISNLTVTPNVLIANNAFPPNNMQELIAHLKANPGKFSYASSGVGSILHLSGEMLKKQAGIDMVHVPYRGSGPAVADLMTGQIQMAFDVIAGAAEHIKAGTVKAIGLAHNKRAISFPNLPTIMEQGLPNFESFTWNGIFAPPQTPKSTVDALTDAFKKVMLDNELKAKLSEMGAFIEGTTGAELQKFFEAQLVTFKPIIEEAGLKTP
jgi:tripartite-type tricarboxylate transporter receptor subunit TctC